MKHKKIFATLALPIVFAFGTQLSFAEHYHVEYRNDARRDYQHSHYDHGHYDYNWFYDNRYNGRNWHHDHRYHDRYYDYRYRQYGHRYPRWSGRYPRGASFVCIDGTFSFDRYALRSTCLSNGGVNFLIW